MATAGESKLHKRLKAAVLSAARARGFNARMEVKGAGWRADVVVASDLGTFAFEVQTTPQPLGVTLERQERYRASGVIGCWLFLNPVRYLSDERPDLPLFQVVADPVNGALVSLGDRRHVRLEDFVPAFVVGLIRFCDQAVSSRVQKVTAHFYEFSCWKCGLAHYPYLLDDSFTAACGAKAHTEENLWGSNRREFWPEVIEAVIRHMGQDDVVPLLVPTVKERFSRTMNESYLSFGCHRCDSLFGDWFIHEAEIDVRYGYGIVTTAPLGVELTSSITVPLPHWCYPENGSFCEADAEMPR